MGAVYSEEVGKAFLEALGLADRKVRSLTLRIALGEAVTITIEEMECLDVSGGAEGLSQAARSLTRYNLVEAEGDAPPSQQYLCQDCKWFFRREPMAEDVCPICPKCGGSNTGVDDGT